MGCRSERAGLTWLSVQLRIPTVTVRSIHLLVHDEGRYNHPVTMRNTLVITMSGSESPMAGLFRFMTMIKVPRSMDSTRELARILNSGKETSAVCGNVGP